MSLLDRIRQEAGTGPTGLANDFSHVLYIVNNSARAYQVTTALQREMLRQNLPALIPPRVREYKRGFLELAAELVPGSHDLARLTEYSEEWVEFLMYAAALAAVPEQAVAGAYHAEENQRRNLARDFRAFLNEAVLHLKEEQLRQLAEQPEADGLDGVSRMFLAAYRGYRQEQQRYAGERFYHALTAYSALHAQVKAGGAAPRSMVLVEDYDDLEPLFREVCDGLGARCRKLGKALEPARGEPRIRLREFMTPLDEAEAVACLAKEANAAGVEVEDIGIVCCGTAVPAVMPFVLERCGMDGAFGKQLGGTPEFGCLRALDALRRADDGQYDALRELLTNPASSWCLYGTMQGRVLRALKEQGMRCRREPLACLRDALQRDEVMAPLPAGSGGDAPAAAREKIEDLLALLATPQATFSEQLDRIIGSKKRKRSDDDDDYYPLLFATAGEMDRVAAACGAAAAHDPRFTETLLRIAGRREYRARRAGMEAVQFPCVAGDRADNLAAKVLFVCGLDSSGERRPAAAAPPALARALDLPTPEAKRQREQEKLLRALRSAARVEASYAFLGMGNEPVGPSMLTRALRADGTFTTERNADEGFLRGYDVTGGAAPHEAGRWSASTSPLPPLPLQLPEEPLRALYARGLTGRDGKKSIPLRDIVAYVKCPRQFGFTVLTRAARLDVEDPEGYAARRGGTFWHRVYELAAAEPRFWTAREKEIAAALRDAFARARTEEAVLRVIGGTEAEIVAQAEQHVFPAFARNEAARQREYGLQGRAREQVISLTLDAEHVITGKVDRMDEGRGTLHVWDYKTGSDSSRRTCAFYSKPRRKGAEPERRFHTASGGDAVQVALYLHLLAANGEAPARLRGGIITRSGRWVCSAPGAFDAAARANCEAAIAGFMAYLDEPRWYLQAGSGLLPPNDPRADFGMCSWCPYRDVCLAMTFYDGEASDAAQDH